MANRTQLTVEILTDTARAAQGLNETANKFEGFAKKAAGFMVAAFAVGGVTDGIQKVISVASDLEQAVGSVDAVFKSNAGQIHAWAQDTTDAIRIPQREFERYAASIGSQLKNAGVPLDALADQTRKVMQLGADLAAQAGTTTAKGIEAIQAAFKGEYEQLENLNVNLKQAQVSTRALEIAQGDQTAAASAAVQQQAVLSLIYEQSADAQGAAARESETFSAQLESLKEKLDNMAGSLGGPMLGALGGLVATIGDLTPAIEPVLGILTNFVTGVASIPLPILGAAAAIGGLALAWGPLTGAMASGGAALRTMATALSGAFSGVGAATGGMGKLSAAMTGVRSGAASMGTALMNAVGGFAGIATGVAAGALVGLVVYLGKLSAASSAAEKAVSAITTALVDQEGNWNATSRAAESAAVSQSEAFQALIEDGFTAGDAVRALTGTWDDWTAVQQLNGQETRNINADTIDLVDAFKDQYQWVTKNAAAQVEANKIMGESATAKEEGIVGANMLAESEAFAAEQAEKTAEAEKKLGEEIKKAQEAADNTGGARFLASIKAETENAQRALEIFTGVLDDFTAKTESTDDATIVWADNLRSTADAFAKAAEAGTLSGDAVAAFDVKALASTATGSDLAKALLAQADAYNQNVVDAYEAAGGANNYMEAIGKATTEANNSRDAFIAMATAAGLLPEQAEAAANSLGILAATQIPPLVFQLIAEDSEARAVVGRLQNEGVDPITMEILAGADGAKGTFDDTLSYMNAEGVAMPPIPLHADPAPAEGVVDEFTGQKIQTPESMVNINGNTLGVNNALRAVMGGHYPVEMTVNGNTLNVNNALRAVMGGMYPVMMQIHGDSGPVNNTIRAVIGGSYSLTVRVTANTDEFYRVYNALPTSKTITQQVVTVPAPAPPGQPVTFAGVTSLAPRGQLSLSRSGEGGGLVRTGTTTTQSGGVTINVSGALDPDSVARRIHSILRTHERRSGGIEIAAI